MRVIAGSARRTLLKTLGGMDTRPTTDRIKETLFNILQYDLADGCFLDLFAGSGGIGIEALSRGAALAVFVDRNPKAADIIRVNLQAAHLEEKALIMNCDALTALKRLERKYRFDYIYLDPPYRCGMEKEILAELRDSTLIDEQSIVIAEASLDTDFEYLEDIGYVMERKKQYKSNQHVFIRRFRPDSDDVK